MTDGGQVLSAIEADQAEFYNTLGAPQDDEVMFIGKKVAQRNKQSRKGAASLPNRQILPSFKKQYRSPNLVTGQKNVHIYKAPNPSFNFRNRNNAFNASNETPMEVYLRSVDGAPISRIADANERRFKKP